MYKPNQLATLFFTPFGSYCYITMTFGLKNAGATYERCMQQSFRDQIGKNLEAYVDDSEVKSKKACNLVSDLEATFANLRKNNIKLNLEKCMFGVSRGKLLGFMVSERGIKANMEKI